MRIGYNPNSRTEWPTMIAQCPLNELVSNVSLNAQSSNPAKYTRMDRPSNPPLYLFIPHIPLDALKPGPNMPKRARGEINGLSGRGALVIEERDNERPRLAGIRRGGGGSAWKRHTVKGG